MHRRENNATLDTEALETEGTHYVAEVVATVSVLASELAKAAQSHRDYMMGRHYDKGVC